MTTALCGKPYGDQRLKRKKDTRQGQGGLCQSKIIISHIGSKFFISSLRIREDVVGDPQISTKKLHPHCPDIDGSKGLYEKPLGQERKKEGERGGYETRVRSD